MNKYAIIKKLPGTSKYRLYSKKKDSKGKRRNLGTFESLSAAKKREKQIQFFKLRNQHADDGVLDGDDKTLQELSDLAVYLEEAGYVDEAEELYGTMDCLDPTLALIPDNQLNAENEGTMNDTYNTFSAPYAERVAFIRSLCKLASGFDARGLIKEADELDALINLQR
jgi:hypothetical protein